ncbi:MAG: germination protein YpeB [Oscillospiraceae bacterium]|nr:germination protein YpeB [Oscillospiraceae bacterium]
MKTIISRRTLVRIISFAVAIIAVLAAADIMYMLRLSKAESSIEYGYQEAVEELAQSADKISATLTKGLYASSPQMMQKLSSELLSEATSAKNALTKLPVATSNLEKTEKFLSQIGNYAYSLSAAAADGSTPSYEDYQTMSTLCDNASTFSDELWSLKSKLLSNDKTITELFSELEDGGESFLYDGLSTVEEGFENTPKLIYDGPFSDHILEKTSVMLENAEEVTEDEAREIAASYCVLDSYQLKSCEYSEEGTMPSYRFTSNGVSCSVTKNGGYVCYMLKRQNVRSSNLSAEEAVESAKEYLSSMGIESMTETYYETYNGVCTVNFAYSQDGVTCYTDLIKVAVALDDGNVIGYDARGFLMNHVERTLSEPSLSETECQSNLSPMLSVISSQLAVIPSDSVEEKLCYEYKCQSTDGRTVLVYVNTETGEEEDILILLETEESVLTV